MQYQNNKIRVRVSGGPVLRSFCKMGARTGLTLLEMILAMTIMAIVFAVIVPQLRPMLTSWDSKAGAGEAVQNGRVLIDHLNRNLSKAVKITTVSDSSTTKGYIEYEDNDGNTCRYDVASNYVEFGVVGDLNDLAGPVSQLQFTCYDACDLDTPITDVNSIRFVKVETTLTNADALGQDKSFIAQAYLRANVSSGGGGTSNFGNENVEAEELTDVADIQLATQVTLPEDGTITSISAYVQGSTVKFLCYALYTDSSGEPGTLIVESVAEALGSTTYHWHPISVTPTALSAGTYWLALAFDFKSSCVRQSTGSVGQTRHRNNNAVANGFLASWGTSDASNSRRLSIYATYTSSGGGQILP
jgi:prepilin-type N-terminal cleavage/methylation domain-containing protein